MKSQQDIAQLKPFQARAVIEHLRKGSVPIEYVPFFTVGRTQWLTLIEDDLENYIGQGGSKVRFINGDYGDGKTHFMSVIQHLALEKKFAVSFVVLTREVPIHKFEVVYQQIVQQLRSSEEQSGLRPLVTQWLNSLEESLTDKPDAVIALTESLRNLPGMNLNFANALSGMLEHRFMAKNLEHPEENESRQEILFQWLEGQKISKKDLQPFQIFESLSKTNSKHLLRSLIAFLKYLGYQGLILLLDELETIIAQGTAVRNSAYENIRLLIDNTEQTEFMHIFFSIIPDVLSSEKGFKSYDALWSRVRSVGEGKKLNYRGVLVDLHRTPLETREFVDLGLCLRQIHEIAYRWDAQNSIQNPLIEKLCETQNKMGLLSEIRLFIKSIISYLDMAEQGNVPDAQSDVIDHITSNQREMEQEKLEQLQPKWDS
ncbi:MAG: DUF2791 family P-loop domain-containing protein [SAR324 cluster bacterium]|nr:DUF2791 family P-loop domain-containing protein [SAR324 cluster bacterium]